jgi:hypothetical protein
MLTAWRRLVEQVETGYSESIYEYTNDASCRNWLDAAWPLLTTAVQTARQAELQSLDDRFLAATEEITTPLMTSDGWWWRRVPVRRGGEFAQDVDALDS